MILYFALLVVSAKGFTTFNLDYSKEVSFVNPCKARCFIILSYV